MGLLKRLFGGPELRPVTYGDHYFDIRERVTQARLRRNEALDEQEDDAVTHGIINLMEANAMAEIDPEGAGLMLELAAAQARLRQKINRARYRLGQSSIASNVRAIQQAAGKTLQALESRQPRAIESRRAESAETEEGCDVKPVAKAPERQPANAPRPKTASQPPPKPRFDTDYQPAQPSKNGKSFLGDDKDF